MQGAEQSRQWRGVRSDAEPL